MRPRVTVATALMTNPIIIFADEPTTALDVMIQAEIMELLLELRESSGVALILITHDLRIVSQVTQPAIENGRLGRRRETVKAINGVTLEVRRDEAFCLVGESGCGKSTVARSIVGLLRPTSGAIYHDGERLVGVASSQLKTYRRITVC